MVLLPPLHLPVEIRDRARLHEHLLPVDAVVDQAGRRLVLVVRQELVVLRECRRCRLLVHRVAVRVVFEAFVRVAVLDRLVRAAGRAFCKFFFFSFF